MMMPIISSDSSIEDLALFALSVHNMIGRMPVAVKTRNSTGVLIDGGEFIIAARECMHLESMFSGDEIRQIYLNEGKHMGANMFASAILNTVGQRIAAIGIIDTLGILSLELFIADQERVERQVGGWEPVDKRFILRRQ
ncbi:MAG TPA: DUF2111 domain-containing protein [Methanocella sp.]|uniref:DUF2111 domain-containing protein n=1 Tax=Methanocella sp. TaxID=2052833 RepID=UPI002C258F28|nr:DUF2111 domain-containing protein [Methanocella sp.]HTY91017.1 DUF2111 domain-containing protein [Methanocella sp.]